jgi:hypothetical protein
MAMSSYEERGMAAQPQFKGRKKEGENGSFEERKRKRGRRKMEGR